MAERMTSAAQMDWQRLMAKARTMGDKIQRPFTPDKEEKRQAVMLTQGQIHFLEDLLLEMEVWRYRREEERDWQEFRQMVAATMAHYKEIEGSMSQEELCAWKKEMDADYHLTWKDAEKWLERRRGA